MSRKQRIQEVKNRIDERNDDVDFLLIWDDLAPEEDQGWIFRSQGRGNRGVDNAVLFGVPFDPNDEEVRQEAKNEARRRNATVGVAQSTMSDSRVDLAYTVNPNGEIQEDRKLTEQTEAMINAVDDAVDILAKERFVQTWSDPVSNRRQVPEEIVDNVMGGPGDDGWFSVARSSFVTGVNGHVVSRDSVFPEVPNKRNHVKVGSGGRIPTDEQELQLDNILAFIDRDSDFDVSPRGGNEEEMEAIEAVIRDRYHADRGQVFVTVSGEAHVYVPEEFSNLVEKREFNERVGRGERIKEIKEEIEGGGSRTKMKEELITGENRVAVLVDDESIGKLIDAGTRVRRELEIQDIQLESMNLSFGINGGGGVSVFQVGTINPFSGTLSEEQKENIQAIIRSEFNSENLVIENFEITQTNRDKELFDYRFTIS